MRKYEHRLQTREQQQKFKEELTEMLLNIQIEKLKEKEQELDSKQSSNNINPIRRMKMNEQSLQNTPFTPGRPVVVPTSSFTREVQESIVDNYFNGTGSVYANTVDNYNRQFSRSNLRLLNQLKLNSQWLSKILRNYLLMRLHH